MKKEEDEGDDGSMGGGGKQRVAEGEVGERRTEGEEVGEFGRNLQGKHLRHGQSTFLSLSMSAGAVRAGERKSGHRNEVPWCAEHKCPCVR